MEELVIDASIVVKWFLREADSERALALRDRHVNGDLLLAAPELLTYEVLNALYYAGVYTISELKKVAAAITGYGMSMYPLEGEYADSAIDASEANKVTIYDGSYLGLAAKLGTKFVTSDAKLLQRLTPEYAKVAVHISQTGR